LFARDPGTGHIGIAVATRFFAVGARVPYIKSGIGAVATQALVNPFYGTRGLKLLAEGVPAGDAVRLLTGADDGQAHRQVHVLDGAGRLAAHTGAACVPWCGHVIHDGFSVAGNMLAGPQVIEATATAYRDGAALPFARRLIAALKAGEAAGGDKRGKQSAALVIHGEEEYSDLDLRVDDHVDPLPELERLERISREHWVHFRPFLPSRRNPAGTTDRTTIEAGIAAGQARDHA
jgi:uncharacterized Ntn-hydrolase superfamily protein